jgi:hypothetical protein
VWDLAACPVSLHANSSASAAVEIVETRPVLLTCDLATRIAFCEDFACPVERIVRAVAPSRDQPHQRTGDCHPEDRPDRPPRVSPRVDLTMHRALINGAAGIVSYLHGQPFSIGAVTVRNGKIAEIDFLADPERVAKLHFDVLGD